MSLPKDVDRGAPRTAAASMATERAGAVRAAAQGRALAARRPETNVKDAPRPALLLRAAKAAGRRKRAGRGGLRSSGRRRNAGPGQTRADRWGRAGRRSPRRASDHAHSAATHGRCRRAIQSIGVNTASDQRQDTVRAGDGSGVGHRRRVQEHEGVWATASSRTRSAFQIQTGTPLGPIPLVRGTPIGFGRRRQPSRARPMPVGEARVRVAAATAIPGAPHPLWRGRNAPSPRWFGGLLAV